MSKLSETQKKEIAKAFVKVVDEAISSAYEHVFDAMVDHMPNGEDEEANDQAMRYVANLFGRVQRAAVDQASAMAKMA